LSQNFQLFLLCWLSQKAERQHGQKYRIKLSETEGTELLEVVKRGKAAAHKRLHAHVLLKTDESDGAGWTDEKISDSFEIRTRTVELLSTIRKRAVEQGLNAARKKAKRSKNTERKLDGEQEAKLVTLCCGEVPQDRLRRVVKSAFYPTTYTHMTMY